jgi:hypothetical protein
MAMDAMLTRACMIACVGKISQDGPYGTHLCSEQLDGRIAVSNPA